MSLPSPEHSIHRLWSVELTAYFGNLCRYVSAGRFEFCSLCGDVLCEGVCLKPGTHWRQSRKDVRHSSEKNYPLSTKSTELNMFNFGDNFDRDTGRQSRKNRRQSTFDKPATNRRQSRQSTLSPIRRRFWRLSTLSPVCTGL